MARKSLLDEIVSGFANAVEDVRHKVVEEGWFGRQVTPHSGHGDQQVTINNADAGQSEPMREFYGKGSMGGETTREWSSIEVDGARMETGRETSKFYGKMEQYAAEHAARRSEEHERGHEVDLDEDLDR